jgi:multidrug efflux pump subunit AcrA (membrane-fusion protein)
MIRALHAFRIPLLSGAILAAFAGSVLAQGSSSLEALLGSERYRASGLHRLSDAERAELLDWLREQGLGGIDVATGAASGASLAAELEEARRVREELAAEVAAARAAAEDARQARSDAERAAQEAETRQAAAERAAAEADQDEFESRLVEPFTGWEGKTVFRLENGSVWRQRLPGRYLHREGDLPQVRIEKNFMGFYQMELLGYDRKIGVTRLE